MRVFAKTPVSEMSCMYAFKLTAMQKSSMRLASFPKRLAFATKRRSPVADSKLPISPQSSWMRGPIREEVNSNETDSISEPGCSNEAASVWEADRPTDPESGRALILGSSSDVPSGIRTG